MLVTADTGPFLASWIPAWCDDRSGVPGPAAHLIAGDVFSRANPGPTQLTVVPGTTPHNLAPVGEIVIAKRSFEYADDCERAQEDAGRFLPHYNFTHRQRLRSLTHGSRQFSAPRSRLRAAR